MAVPLKDRPKATLDNVKAYLNKLEPKFANIKFKASEGKRGLKISLKHPGTIGGLNKFKQGIFKELKGNFTGLMTSSNIVDKDGFKIIKFQNLNRVIDFDVDLEGVKFEGAIPAYIHEEGTTKILNRALKGANKFSLTKDRKNVLINNKPIENDKVYTQLLKVFGPLYKPRLRMWLWTFYQQQEKWLNEYGKITWDPFVFGRRDFVTFFTEHITKLERETGEKVIKYEDWDPADIWAVKGVTSVKNRLREQFKITSLYEMNNLLIELMEREELVGISLKMITQGKEAKLQLFNVDTSPILTSLKTFKQLEKFKMKDIKFKYDKIWSGENESYMPTRIDYGPTGRYYIQVQRKGKNICFTTRIQGAAAQGGLTPIEMVAKIFEGTDFSTSHKDYPQTPTELVKDKKIKKMYEFLIKRKEGQGAPSYNEWQLWWERLYSRDENGKRNAIVRLMYIKFWYTSLTLFSKENCLHKDFKKSTEFWTDMLYIGMKMKNEKEFAPHAKISE